MAKFSDRNSSLLLEAANSEAPDGEVAKVVHLNGAVDLEKGACKNVKASESKPAAATSTSKLKPITFWIPFMVITGGSVDYAADFFTDYVRETGISASSIGDSAQVFIITALSFLACAVPPTFKQADRASIREVNAINRWFKYKILVPSIADLVITGLRFSAILFASPAVVSLLKNSMQLLSLSAIQHFRGKRLTCRLTMCLLGAFLGQVVVSSVSIFKHEPGVDGRVALGVLLACISGFLGAIRNIIEEALLQQDNLSTGALLMAESWISFSGLVISTLLWHSVHGQVAFFLHDIGSICSTTEVWPILLVLMFCTYGKDFGKLFVTKYSSALMAKVCSMLFPIVTWILVLITFASTRGRFGEGLDAVSSPIRLAGFSVVAGSCVAFVVLQKKK